MQTLVENPLMTIESFNLQFQLGNKIGKLLNGDGDGKWEKPCSMW